MWYVESEQFVRAPTPPSFDRLVAKLESGDSVLFESISFPLRTNSSRKFSKTPHSIEIPELFLEGTRELSFSDRSFENSDFPRTPRVSELRGRLEALEFEGARKTQVIEEKDELIQTLETRLTDLQKKKGQTGTETHRLGSETVEFYKTRYENVLLELQTLKTSLSQEGKLRKVSVRSARAIRPRVQ
jgi:hypothetical protein